MTSVRCGALFVGSSGSPAACRWRIPNCAVKHRCPYQIFRACWACCGCGPETDTFSGTMTALFVAVLASCRTTLRSRLELAAEILALRHQLAVLQRTTPTRPRLRPIDRLLWVLLSSVWPNWRHAVQIVTPATVVRWHRRAFAAYWRWNSRPRAVSAGRRWPLTFLP